MLKVAVTGNIGSGKTLISRVFETLKAPVFYADREAKKLYDDPSVLKKLAELFGYDILNNKRDLNKNKLAEVIFSNKENLEKINAFIHPKVYYKFNTWLKHQKNQPYCIQEAAIIFETGSYKLFDKTILVYAPENLLIERVMKRDSITRKQVLQRLENQMPQKQKAELADYIITNDNSCLLLPQLLKIHNELIKLSDY